MTNKIGGHVLTEVTTIVDITLQITAFRRICYNLIYDENCVRLIRGGFKTQPPADRRFRAVAIV